ncbi:acyl-CoA carboxylase epsilon subunit [Streptomyces sp. IBSBF 2806]|uniref:acyl-CoA carboxylase epsilon subunit n=1 Tax=Streptomyces sp. IBSBF 2806 TaxID=2903529 RepID=UPI002FDC685E
MAAAESSRGDVSRTVTAHSWRITSGSPTAEEVAAIAVALSTVLAAQAAQEAQEADAGSRDGARWTPFSARRRTATSWAADPGPGWRGAA